MGQTWVWEARKKYFAKSTLTLYCLDLGNAALEGLWITWVQVLSVWFCSCKSEHLCVDGGLQSPLQLCWFMNLRRTSVCLPSLSCYGAGIATREMVCFTLQAVWPWLQLECPLSLGQHQLSLLHSEQSRLWMFHVLDFSLFFFPSQYLKDIFKPSIHGSLIAETWEEKKLMVRELRFLCN